MTSGHRIGTAMEAIKRRLGPNRTEELILEARAEIQALHELIEHRATEADTIEQALASVNDRLSEQARRESDNARQRLALALLLLHDNMTAAIANLNTTTDENTSFAGDQNESVAVVAELHRQLLSILYAEGIEPLPRTGGTFDYKLQRAVGTVPTTDADEDGTIGAIVGDGFRSINTGMVLRPQAVEVKRLIEALDTVP